jgi:hypothetical protein
MSDPISLGSALRATCIAIQELVNAWHTGALPSMATSRSSHNARWTPSYIQGRAPQSPDSKPYSALLISLMLGNATSSRHAHPIVKLALLILELREVGAMDDQDMEDVFAGEDGFTRTLLEKVLDKTRNIHFEQSAALEATSILESC